MKHSFVGRDLVQPAKRDNCYITVELYLKKNQKKPQKIKHLFANS